MGSRIALKKETFTAAEDQRWLGSALGTTECESITLEADTFLTDFTDGVIPSGVVLSKVGNLYRQYKPGTEVNEVQSIIATGGTAGDFTLSLGAGGETTAAIAYNATAAQVQAALEALFDVDPGDIVCTGGPLPETAVTITYGGKFADTDVPLLVVTDNITGGTATVTQTTAGGGTAGTAGQTVAAGILFTTVDLGGTTAATVDNVSAALFWGPGRVIKSKLPAASGLDSAAEAALSHIRFVA